MALPILPIALALAQFAPSILRYLGVGESGVKVAEEVVNAAQVVTGAKTPEEALEAIRANAQLQTDFQKFIIEKDGELERAYLTDRQDARARDAKFLAAGTRNYRADFLSALAIVVVVIVWWQVMKAGDLDEFQKGVITLFLGRFLGYIDQIFQFEFGSTRSNKTKDETIANLSR
jgi:hypothetical protein